jgi:hypothetical protein
MVEEEVEQEILGEWNSIAEDQEAIAALTRRTKNLLRGFKGNLVSYVLISTTDNCYSFNNIVVMSFMLKTRFFT